MLDLLNVAFFDTLHRVFAGNDHPFRTLFCSTKASTSTSVTEGLEPIKTMWRRWQPWRTSTARYWRIARLSRSNNFVQVASRTSLTVCLFRLSRCPIVTKPRLGSVGSKSAVERSREWQLQELYSGSNNLECCCWSTHIRPSCHKASFQNNYSLRLAYP